MNSPYTPPTTSLVKETSYSPHTDAYGNPLPQLLLEPRSCNAAAGIGWLTQAFNLFKSNFLLWIGIMVVFVVIMAIGGALPFIGLLFNLLVFVFIGGIIKGANVQATGGELRFDHLFSGFQTHFVPLIIVGLLYLVAIIVAMIPLFIALGGMALSMFSGDVSSVEQSISGLFTAGVIIAYLLFFFLLIPLVMAIWFAPSLIVLHNVAPIEAMKKSFKGCLKNILPMFVYGLIFMFVAPLVMIFTLGLGFFAVVPVMLISYYTSYRDVWTDQPVAALP